MALVIDLTDEDQKQGCHWLAAKATPGFEKTPLPPYHAKIITPWPPESAGLSLQKDPGETEQIDTTNPVSEE